MFFDKSSKRITPGGTLSQPAGICEKHRQEVAYQCSPCNSETQQNIIARIFRHLSLTLQNADVITPSFLLTGRIASSHVNFLAPPGA